MLCGTYEDLIYAYRRMMGQPGFTFVAVLILAVGIGVTTAMSSTIKAALLSRLPFDEPDCLVMGRATFDRNVNPWVSGYDYYDYKEQSQSFESLSALFAFGNRVTVVGGAEPERIAGGFVTWDLFHTLRVRPAVGRLFAAEEGAAGRSNVVMISYGYWQRRFGGSPDVVGSTLIVNGNPLTIIGVMPAGFYFLDNLDIWRLTYYNGPGAQARRWRNLLLVGRLKPGITIQQAQSEMDLISRRLEEQYPDTNKGKALLVTGLHDTMIEDVRTSLLMLMVAVSLVLLLACGNVAGLLLAKGQSRLRELAIRSAMGASRRRLVCQLLTESALMALVAGIVGVGFAIVFQGMLMRLLPMGRLGIARPDIDAPVLLFTLLISIACGLLFGVVPALQSTIVEPSQELRAGTRSTTARGTSVLRSGLVALQVAISIMLLTAAGLLIRSRSNQMKVDLGFNPTHVLTAGVLPPENDYPEAKRRIAFFTTLLEQVEALPGVVSVGLIDRIPIRHPSGNIYVYPADQPPGGSQVASMSRSADFRCVLPGYLVFSSIAILLALVGLHGALAYHVSQRYHEIGVRMALGASRRLVASIVLSRGMGMVAAGLVLGVTGSYWAAQLLQQLLFGVEAADPTSFVAAAVSFVLIAFIACLLPAWRATRVDPIIIMQAE